MDANGNLVDDFVFDSGHGPLSSRLVHVPNGLVQQWILINL